MKESAFLAARHRLFGDAQFRLPKETGERSLLLPIQLTMLYLAITVVLYIVGPFNWITYKPVLFYSLLVLYMGAMWFGYRLGLMRRFKRAIDWTEDMTDKLIRIISPLIVLNCLFYIINIFREYGFTSLDLPGLLQQMWVGIRNPGLGYNLHLERIAVYQGSDVIGGYALSLLNYGWAFVELPIEMFAMLYFRRLKPYAKCFAVFYLVLTVAHYLSIGTNIRIFHVFLLAELPAIVSVLSDAYRKQINGKKVFKFIVSMLIGFALILCYFTWMMVSRGGINSYDQPDYNVGGITISLGDTEEEPDPEAPAETAEGPAWVPPIVMKFWISFCNYLTQGYYGMSLALTEPWTPMFGLGSSMFVVDFISEHIYDIDPFTYSVKIEHYGWDSDMRWPSMYTWLANDVSFYGVVLVMLLIGFLFAEMYKDAVSTANPFAKASLFYFMLMIFFIPCNNQLAQTPIIMFSFILIVLCWFFTKHPLKKWVKQ